MRKNERGFAVAWGVLLLAFVMFFTAGVYTLADRRARGAARELLTTDLRLAAESGLIAAAAELTSDVARRDAVNNASGEVVFAALTEGDITTTVFLKKDGAGGFYGQATAGTKRLLSWEKNSKNSLGTRVIGRIGKKTAPDGTEKYTVTYWEH